MKNFTGDHLVPENMKGLVLVDFWAPWCGPCRMAAPILESLSEEYAGKVEFGKLNIDDEPDAAIRLGVMSIPTLVLFENGEAVDTSVGAKSKPAIISMLSR